MLDILVQQLHSSRKQNSNFIGISTIAYNPAITDYILIKTRPNISRLLNNVFPFILMNIIVKLIS